MKTDNPFDKKIELYKTLVLNKPERLIDSAIFVTDTLELCLASAQAVFEEEATPKLALEIYDRVVERMIELEHEINIPTPSAEVICRICGHSKNEHKYIYGKLNPCSMTLCHCSNFIPKYSVE